MLNIGSKTLRNLPEQVAENLKQIGLIWQKLDGLDVYDNVIIIEDLSNLNEEQLIVVARPVSFIVYQDVVYVKKGNVGAYALFSPYYSIEADEYITIKSSELKVQFPLGEVTISELEVELYDKDEVDALLLSKVYPVGAVYMSTVSASPASLFGGTWEALNNGNAINLSVDSSAPVYNGSRHDIDTDFGFTFKDASSGNNVLPADNTFMGIGSAGGAIPGQAFNMLPGPTTISTYQTIVPDNLYADLTGISVYMWKRVA